MNRVSKSSIFLWIFQPFIVQPKSCHLQEIVYISLFFWWMQSEIMFHSSGVHLSVYFKGFKHCHKICYQSHLNVGDTTTYIGFKLNLKPLLCNGLTKVCVLNRKNFRTVFHGRELDFWESRPLGILKSWRNCSMLYAELYTSFPFYGNPCESYEHPLNFYSGQLKTWTILKNFFTCCQHASSLLSYC